MKHSKILSIILAISFPIFIFGQDSKLPAPGKPRDFQLPKKVTTNLKNGLTSTLVPFGVVPTVTVSVIIKTGNAHEGADEVWLSDLVGDLMNEGTTKMTNKEIAQKVAAMGGDVSISTGYNQTTISGSVLSEFAPDLVKILADIVMNPAFPESEFGRIKADLKRNLAVQKNVPQSQAVEKFYSIIYKDHAYGRYFPTQEMLDSFTLEMVKSFYDQNFGAKRTSVYVVGKFDQEKIMHAIAESFDSWKEGPAISYPPASATPSNEIAIIDRPGAPQTTIMVGLPTLDASQKDYLPLQVTNSVLGGSFGSRITANLREDKGYSYSPFSTIVNRYRTAVWFEFADVSTEHTGASLQEISREISRLQQEPTSEEELLGIKKYEAGKFVLQNSTANGIIGQLDFLDLHDLPESYLTERVKNIYDLTPGKLQQMAQKYFNYDQMTIVLVGDKKQIEKQIGDMERNLKEK